jgi:hypothetical protein
VRTLWVAQRGIQPRLFRAAVSSGGLPRSAQSAAPLVRQSQQQIALILLVVGDRAPQSLVLANRQGHVIESAVPKVLVRCAASTPTTGGRELQPTRYTEPELTLLLERLKLVLPDQPPPNYRRPGRRAPPEVPTFKGRRQHLQRVDHRRPVEWPTSANALSCSILILPTSARRAAQINVRRLPTRPPFSATRPMLRRRAARRRAMRSNRRSP